MSVEVTVAGAKKPVKVSLPTVMLVKSADWL
jgi:hypothetical protein